MIGSLARVKDRKALAAAHRHLRRNDRVRNRRCMLKVIEVVGGVCAIVPGAADRVLVRIPMALVLLGLFRESSESECIVVDVYAD